MSLTPNYSSIYLQSPFKTPYNLIFLRIRSLEFRECRVWKRRRLKINRRCAVRNQLGPFGPSPFENLFQNLVSQFPSVNSLDLIAPALGFASGVAFYLSRFSVDKNLEVPDIGEWILFTSPTPFNRFVLLRCQSISFDGGELLEDVNEKLVKEDRHFVRLNSGRIQARDYSGRENHNHLVEKLEYQRVCVGTDDGGVISLDWPTNLKLEEEHGLDTTLLLIPGTAQGSMDRTIRSFVCECLKRGFFPVVMNPRGCAGSPLTTARLFTAADSDDICTAIQFVNKARPWTTLMGVGWGYGANMLTKYLAEVGEKTPLTAATCIDNPFDLEEATRSSPYHIAINQKITGGLIDILRSNKELFQGKTKGYDVEKALSAKSVRDFEKAISIVTHGFDSIEDFYSKSSTRGVIGNVKIPVLFIQNDDGTVPLFSIPRSLIAENPYTSLLLCSSVQSSFIESGRSVIFWCQHLIIEWLAAVELGLLKGRHPLLRDVDVTINPSKGLALMEGRSSDKEGRVHKLPELARANAINEHFVDPTYKMHRESGTAASIQRSRQDSERNLGLRDTKLQEMDNGALQQSDSLGTKMLKEDEVSSIDNEKGQVLQTTQVVMNMLEVTMPETLTEEQKKKVLTAVGRGETLMKALQDAVPEDVRGKLTNAVSGLLHSQGTNLKIEGLLRIGQENGPGTSQRSPGLGESQPTDSDYSPSAKKGTNDSGNNTGNDEFYNDKNSPNADHMENGPETSSRDDRINTDAGGGVVQSDIKDDNNIQNSEEVTLDSPDQNNATSSARTEESLSPQGSSSEAQLQGNDNLKREDKNIQPILDQNMSVPSDSNPPTFSVSQALDALTGMDDSTQVAVNSIFGVIEDMITHLEEAKDNGNELQDRNEVKDIKPDYELEKKQENKNELSLLPDVVHFNPAYDAPRDHMESHIEAIKGVFEEKLTQNPVSVDDNVVDCSLGNNTADLIVKNDNETEENLVASEVFEDLDGFRHVVNIPLHRGISPYGDSFYKEYYKKYLLSKMPDTKSLDMDTTATMLLDYIPEDGQWKLLEQPANAEDSNADTGTSKGDKRKVQVSLRAKPSGADTIIEPPYVIVDTEIQQQKPDGESKIEEKINKNGEVEDDELEELTQFVKNIIVDSLKVEVGRRLSTADMKAMKSDLARDMEQIAYRVSLALQHDKEHNRSFKIKVKKSGHTSEKVGTLYVEHIIKAISFAIREASCLRRVLPVGVIVGSSLAALRRFFTLATMSGGEALNLDEDYLGKNYHGQADEMEVNYMPAKKADQNTSLDISRDEKAISKNLKNDTVMVGAVTAALGASALLAHQQDVYKNDQTTRTSSMYFKEKVDHQKGPDKLQEAISGKTQNNVVTSLAEKAMSVAAPVVPTKEDGELDQERLVAMMAELGQKGGLLRLVGKIALLWGGIRGAMSLTDRLILFLRIAERPLLQRILAFVCMVLVLWSPVVVPLLPRLVQSWATHNSSRFSELACIVGLYIAVMFLIMLWGKRIRGYDNPLQEYGLDFAPSSKKKNFLKAFIGGAVLVFLIQTLNALLGWVSLSLPSSLPSSSLHSVTWLKVYGRMLFLAVQGIVTASAITLVEELVFRSWLPEEISTDLGYHHGIILSGLAFSLLQRSPQAVPGLLLLSLALAGARQRSEGSLLIPIGLRAGIMASSFILEMGGFLTYQSTSPIWVSGIQPTQPFSGIVGLAFSLLMAVVLYPR